MAKFIMLYRGPATPPENMSVEQSDEVLKAWTSWIENVGEAMVDVGNPFGAGTAVKDDGSDADTSDLSGYTIVTAADLDSAKAFCDNHPFLSEGKGNFAVEIFELLEIPM